MKGAILVLTLLFLTACTTQETIEQTPNEVFNMNLKSNDFNQGDMIQSKFTCQGENINPHLAWDDVPTDTKSFALIVDDPDAPSGNWVHWLVKDIPSDIREIQQNSIPGKQVNNDFGKGDYGGPCPPSGTHRYFFKLFALDVETLDAETAEDLYQQAEQHAIAKAELMGTYEKT